MEKTQYLQIPGPTNIPYRILRTLSQPLINHRGDDFRQLVSECILGLKKVFRTNNDILMFSSSGSGMLESIIVNVFSPGDSVLAVSQGVFSERMASIADRHGLHVIRLKKELGYCVDPIEVGEILESDKSRKIIAVCLPHNETSTGACNDIEAIATVIRKTGHPALLIVDATSSLACIPLETEVWGVDVVATGSQKGLMIPPGLGIVSISTRAWQAIQKATMPRWYWDYQTTREALQNSLFPYTPATTLLFGLREALRMLLEEGMERVWERHRMIAEAVRASVSGCGLDLFVKSLNAYSNSLTSVVMPNNISFTEFSKRLKRNFNVEVGGGLQELRGKVFRIGHMGNIHTLDIYAVLGAIEMTLYSMGYSLKLGTSAECIANMLVSETP